jgi:predicted lipoprotein with Yx(FWY)xxD motif
VSECGPHGRARHSADRGAATQCRRGMRTLPSSPCAAGRARAGAKVSSCARTAQARSICAGVNPCGGPIRIWKWIGVLRVRSRVEFEGLRRDTNMGLRQRGSWPTDGGVASEGRSLRSRRRHRLVYSGGVAAIGLMLVAGCGSDGSSSDASTQSSGGAAASGAVVQMKNQTLVDSSGMTLYTSDKEARGQVVCTGPCLNFWTPLTISGGAPPTVNGVALTTIKRSDDGKLSSRTRTHRFIRSRSTSRPAT